MMTIGEKVRKLVQEAGYKKPGAFYKAMAALHEQETITVRTFYNLLHDRTPPREHTLNQVALVLGIKTSELRMGTDREIKSPPEGEQYIHTSRYSYNPLANLFTYNIKAPFLPLKLILRAGGQTTEEYDSPDAKESIKFVWVIIGKITVVVKGQFGAEKHQLHNGQTFIFDARQPHYFINESKSNSIVHIIHHPAQNNSLHFS